MDWLSPTLTLCDYINCKYILIDLMYKFIAIVSLIGFSYFGVTYIQCSASRELEVPMSWLCLCIETKKAESGDMNAVQLVAEHYYSAEGNTAAATPWIKLASSHGKYPSINTAYTLCNQANPNFPPDLIAKSIRVGLNNSDDRDRAKKLDEYWKKNSNPKCPYLSHY
jgi:hypothetical protein